MPLSFHRNSYWETAYILMHIGGNHHCKVTRKYSVIWDAHFCLKSHSFELGKLDWHTWWRTCHLHKFKRFRSSQLQHFWRPYRSKSRWISRRRIRPPSGSFDKNKTFRQPVHRSYHGGINFIALYCEHWNKSSGVSHRWRFHDDEH